MRAQKKTVETSERESIMEDANKSTAIILIHTLLLFRSTLRIAKQRIFAFHMISFSSIFYIIFHVNCFFLFSPSLSLSGSIIHIWMML